MMFPVRRAAISACPPNRRTLSGRPQSRSSLFNQSLNTGIIDPGKPVQQVADIYSVGYFDRPNSVLAVDRATTPSHQGSTLGAPKTNGLLHKKLRKRPPPPFSPMSPIHRRVGPHGACQKHSPTPPQRTKKGLKRTHAARIRFSTPWNPLFLKPPLIATACGILDSQHPKPPASATSFALDCWLFAHLRSAPNRQVVANSPPVSKTRFPHRT